VHLKGADSMTTSGLSFRNNLVGSGWATAILLCMNSLRKLALQGVHFQLGSFFLSLGEWLPAECHDYCKLVNGWVWLESQMCRGWLQEHLCEVWGADNPTELGIW